MIDIDAEFRAAMGIATTANRPVDDEPLTIEKLQEAMRKLGPPPPEIRLSKHVPVTGTARPSSQPITDDMRAMVDDIGPQRVPIAWRLNSQFGEVVLINPANLKERNSD